MSGAKASVVPKRLRESEISEGNLAELPFWVLTTKEAKPPVPIGKDGKPDLRNYVRKTEKIEALAKGITVTRRFELTASPHYGFPTMFAARVLFVLLSRARLQPELSPKVYVTIREVAVRLGYKHPGAKVYRLIEHSLDALKGISFTARNFWLDKTTGEKLTELRASGLITEIELRTDEQAELDFRLDRRRARPSSITLSEALVDSLKAGYLYGIDLDYMNALKSPTAQRLYHYLAKKDDKKSVYKEGLKSLADKLYLKSSKLSVIQTTIKRALEALESETLVNGEARRFLAGWSVAEGQMTVTFYSQEQQKSAEQMAEYLANFDRDPEGQRRARALFAAEPGVRAGIRG